MHSFFLQQNLLVVAALLFASLFLVTGAGYLFGKRHGKQASSIDKRDETAETITWAMFSFFGFMLVVAISMADSHFQARRKLILDEAKAISTSLQHARTIGGRHGAEIARLLRDYTHLRFDFYSAEGDRKRLSAVYEQVPILKERIWGHASSIARAAPTSVTALLLTALNEMFDLGTAIDWIFEVRVPPYVIELLCAFSFLTMGMMGYYFGVCGVWHYILVPLLIVVSTAAIVLVIDLDRPKSGYVHPEEFPLLHIISSPSPDSG